MRVHIEFAEWYPVPTISHTRYADVSTYLGDGVYWLEDAEYDLPADLVAQWEAARTALRSANTAVVLYLAAKENPR